MYRFLLPAILQFLVFTGLKAQNTLQVTIKSIGSSKGRVLFALFNQETGFPENSKHAFLLREVPAQKGSIQLVINGVPSGQYALAVFHDANGDGKLNTNLLGIPKEAYGFSNNARPAFSAPAFNEAAIRVEGNAYITVQVK